MISTVSGERCPCPRLASRRTFRTLTFVEQMGSGLACRAGESRSVPETRVAGTACSRSARVEPVSRVRVRLPRVCFFPGASSVVWSERPGFSVPGHHLRCLGCRLPRVPRPQVSRSCSLAPRRSRCCCRTLLRALPCRLQGSACRGCPKPSGLASRTSPARPQLALAALCPSPDVCQPPWAAGAPTGPRGPPYRCLCRGFSSAAGRGLCDLSEAVGPARLSKSFLSFPCGEAAGRPLPRALTVCPPAAPLLSGRGRDPGLGPPGVLLPGPGLYLAWDGQAQSLDVLLSVSWSRRG